jgi:hypothetical protein
MIQKEKGRIMKSGALALRVATALFRYKYALLAEDSSSREMLSL